MRPPTRVLGLFSLCGAMAGATLTAGCATTDRSTDLVLTTDAAGVSPATSEQAAVVRSSPEFIPVFRYGRYTLVELVPQSAQRDLMQQVVEVAIPSTLDANVGDAMRHVLLRSGYRLCDSAKAMTLYALPLPAAHLRLGPLVLRDALLTLAGPAWDLSVDDVARQVCFQRRAAATNSAIPAPNVDQATADETRKEQP